MLKRILRRSKWDYTPIELYQLWETTFFNKQIKSQIPKKEISMKIDNMFLRRENRRLEQQLILSS